MKSADSRNLRKQDARKNFTFTVIYQIKSQAKESSEGKGTSTMHNSSNNQKENFAKCERFHGKTTFNNIHTILTLQVQHFH